MLNLVVDLDYNTLVAQNAMERFKNATIDALLRIQGMTRDDILDIEVTPGSVVIVVSLDSDVVHSVVSAVNADDVKLTFDGQQLPVAVKKTPPSESSSSEAARSGIIVSAVVGSLTVCAVVVFVVISMVNRGRMKLAPESSDAAAETMATGSAVAAAVAGVESDVSAGEI